MRDGWEKCLESDWSSLQYCFDRGLKPLRVRQVPCSLDCVRVGGDLSWVGGLTYFVPGGEAAPFTISRDIRDVCNVHRTAYHGRPRLHKEDGAPLRCVLGTDFYRFITGQNGISPVAI